MQPEEFQAVYNVSRETFGKLKLYSELLVKWQKAINLVSPGSLEHMWERHFADSAQLASLVPASSKVADLGSGAGFPGMVLAIMRPDLNVHLIESDGRKCEFLKNVSRETETDIIIHNTRVEEALDGTGSKIIVARGFAPLSKILDYAAPSIEKNPDLVLILLKGKDAAEEIKDAQKKWNFTVKQTESRTDRQAKILEISQVTEK
ncbi:MAG: 16S rRNA (guanine(527)-N(7))-methyltransferase RsmG [Alphaproteobacteria bacterium]|nr:16S rRNA (guanine(527)-N(7))-methyltransferase RsmG [Alphaproteobacteria bacterium]